MDGADLVNLAHDAGLPYPQARVAAAIAIAESGGDPNSHNSTPPDDSYGLWQINMLGSLGPARRTLYGLKANTDLFDPKTNARVMSAISSQGQNFSAWTTYTSGKYKQYLSNIDSQGSSDNGGILGSLSDAYDTAKQGVNLAAEALSIAEKGAVWISKPSNWLRIGYVIAGGAAVLLGLGAVIRSSSAGKATIKAGKKVVKTGVKAAAVAA